MACLLYLLLLVLPIWLGFVSTSVALKWISLGFAGLFLVGGWIEAAPAEADIPPCHMMLPFALWSMVAYRHWFYPTRRPYPLGHCRHCGYNLTGNISGVCPECGQTIGEEDRAQVPDDSGIRQGNREDE